MAFREIRDFTQPEQASNGEFDFLQLLPLILALAGKAAKPTSGGGVKLQQGSERADIVGQFLDIRQGGTGVQPVEAVEPTSSGGLMIHTRRPVTQPLEEMVTPEAPRTTPSHAPADVPSALTDLIHGGQRGRRGDKR